MEFRKPYILYDFEPSPAGERTGVERRMARRDDDSTYLVDIGTFDQQAAINSCSTMDIQAVIDAFTHGNSEPLQLHAVGDVDFTALPDNPYALHRALALAKSKLDDYRRIAPTTPAEAQNTTEEVNTNE